MLGDAFGGQRFVERMLAIGAWESLGGFLPNARLSQAGLNADNGPDGIWSSF